MNIIEKLDYLESKSKHREIADMLFLQDILTQNNDFGKKNENEIL